MDGNRNIEKKDIYEQAERLAAEQTEVSLKKAMELYQSIAGWEDADRKYADCRTLLGRMQWQAESARLKVYEERSETSHNRLRKVLIFSLVAVLLCVAVLTTVSLVRFKRYSRASEYLIAGQYEIAAEAFMQMADYRDSRTRVYEAAVGMFRNKQYEKALPYFIWLGEGLDGGYYLRKCREHLGLDPLGSLRSDTGIRYR